MKMKRSVIFLTVLSSIQLTNSSENSDYIQGLNRNWQIIMLDRALSDEERLQGLIDKINELGMYEIIAELKNYNNDAERIAVILSEVGPRIYSEALLNTLKKKELASVGA